MRIRPYSDLHFEFMSPARAREFVSSLPTEGVDAVVLAGDIADKDGIYFALKLFVERFVGKPIFYVLGNHEHWGADRAAVHRCVEKARRDFPEVRWLDRVVPRWFQPCAWHGEDATVYVTGTTLWFPETAFTRRERNRYNAFKARAPQVLDGALPWSDFRKVPGLARWHGEEFQASKEFLEDKTETGTLDAFGNAVASVNVTHYLPSKRCVHPKYAGAAENDFFVGDVEHIIHENPPTVWIHGHTHVSLDHQIGKTRVVCNPRGYEGVELNPNFDPALIVEV